MGEENSIIHEKTQFLTFKLGDEMYSVEVLKVREVLDYLTITRIPKTPDFMRGIINVRGDIVPVIDLKLKLILNTAKTTQNTRIIIMELSVNGETRIIGTIADSVEDVRELDPEHIEPPPKMGNRWKSDFIKGIAKCDDEFIIILDIEKVFSTEELEIIKSSEISAASD